MITNIPCEQCKFDPTLKVVGSWLLELPVEAISANQLGANNRGRSGWRYRKVRDSFYEQINARCRDIPKATAKRRVFFTRHYAGRKRLLDRDNLIAGFKPVRDCLTMLGLILNDNDSVLEAHYQQRSGHMNYVTICLEDILWPTMSQ